MWKLAESHKNVVMYAGYFKEMQDFFQDLFFWKILILYSITF